MVSYQVLTVEFFQKRKVISRKGGEIRWKVMNDVRLYGTCGVLGSRGVRRAGEAGRSWMAV